MRGRKPKPTRLKILTGNPGRRPLNPAEPVPPPTPPDCPDHLDGEARAEWGRITPLLAAMGILSEVDRAALAGYCAAYGRWVEAERQVRKYGTIVTSPDKGFPMKSPYLCIAESSLDQMRRLLVEFGLTPSSRSRVHVDPEQRGSRLDEFLGGRKLG
jgi:P27 family predicted phage terminase small subunit